MRVISGTRRHILLQTVNNLSIRPTTDKIKETLFNIIQFQIQDTNVLDLFAGSGALGIECLSRGSLHATFVDNNKQAINCINYNIEKTNFKEVSNVFHMSALQFIKYKNNYCYDIVFLDPPYDKNLYIDILIELKNNTIINNNTILILETTIDDDLNKISSLGYDIFRVKEYKTNKHAFFKRI